MKLCRVVHRQGLGSLLQALLLLGFPVSRSFHHHLSAYRARRHLPASGLLRRAGLPEQLQELQAQLSCLCRIPRLFLMRR